MVGILNIRDVHRKIFSLLGESYGKMYLSYRGVRKVGSQFLKKFSLGTGCVVTQDS